MRRIEADGSRRENAGATPLWRRRSCLSAGLKLGACWGVGRLGEGLSQEAGKGAGAKREIFLMLPEPRAMRGPRSLVPNQAARTVLTPARETAESPFIETYPAAAFEALGISPETFLQRAQSVADRLLGELRPEWIRDRAGSVLYAVYRGDRPIHASLLIAPSLPGLFEAEFGAEIWVTAPDRKALYVFPAKAAALSDFAADLESRYRTDPYAATCEIFSWKKGKTQPAVVGAFAD